MPESSKPANSAQAKVPHVKGNTFEPIDLDPKALAGLSFPQFVEELMAKILELKDRRFNWYADLRNEHSDIVNGERKLLAWLGTLAILFTAAAAAFRISGFEAIKLDSWPCLTYAINHADMACLAVALALYVVMGAIAFYEKATDNTSAYFRHLGVTLAIRDLWTKLQFEFLKSLLALKAGDATAENAAREQLRSLAEAFCNDLDKIASAELTEWRTEFMSSLSELEEAAKKGSEDLQPQFKAAMQAYQKATADAKAATKAAEKAAYVDLKISGDTGDGEITVRVDDVEVARTHLKTYVIDRLMPGFRKFQALAKNPQGKDIEAIKLEELKSGRQSVELKLA